VTVANVLVVIELCGGKALPVCLEALGQARRVSTALGATLYALVPLGHAPTYSEDDLIAVLASHGADKVVLVTDEVLAAGTETMRWGTHGSAVSMVSDLLPPSLLLFGATPGGREVAARAAARMGAAFLSEAWVELVDGKLALWEGAGEDALALDGELEFPVVATVPPGRYAIGRGDDEAEVEVLNTGGRPADFEQLGWEIDPRPGALVLAPDELREPAAALARALSGDTAPDDGGPTRIAVSLGPRVDGVQADVRVALGAAQPGAHYTVEGAPDEVARALAQAIAEVGGVRS
jgi:hypothetical protein